MKRKIFILGFFLTLFVSAFAVDGSIVVIEEYLYVSTQSSETIEEVKVYNLNYEPILTLQGCSATQCNFDISSLNKGLYIIAVKTNTQEYFSKVTIK
jgi:hypothetical protein